MHCPRCRIQYRPEARFCYRCGGPLDAGGPAGPGEVEGDATGGVIPYRNPPALLAYYLGLFSAFPCLGLPLGIAAVVLGIQGLKRRRLHPVVKGTVHAWIGIGCGGLAILVWGGLAIAMIVALLADGGGR